jgi:hypothetical protein
MTNDTKIIIPSDMTLEIAEYLPDSSAMELFKTDHQNYNARKYHNFFNYYSATTVVSKTRATQDLKLKISYNWPSSMLLSLLPSKITHLYIRNNSFNGSLKDVPESVHTLEIYSDKFDKTKHPVPGHIIHYKHETSEAHRLRQQMKNIRNENMNLQNFVNAITDQMNSMS